MDVWDLAAGSVHHSFLVTASRVSAVNISADGRFLAVPGTDHVRVYDVRTGREVATMRDPPDDAAGPAAGAAGPAPFDRPRRRAVGGRRAFTAAASVRDVAFSPDGRQLAGLFGLGRGGRLVVWDSGGRVAFDTGRRSVPSMLEPDDSHRDLQWSPDGTRLLLAGRWLMDAKTGVMLWRAADRVGIDRLPVFLDDARRLAWQADVAALEPLNIPTADIKASLAALADRRAAAVLRPGQTVSLTVDLTGGSPDTAGQTSADLTRAMTDALTAAGLTVADGQPTVFHLTFAETAGTPVRVVQERSPFDARSRDAGQMVPSVDGRLTIEVRPDRGSGSAVWTQEIVGRSPPRLDGPADAAAVRAGMFKDVCGAVGEVVLPSFIPADPGLKPLPIAGG